MRKLIIQIPCYNEADSLPLTLKALPRAVNGYSCVEVLVIDDGSNDKTAEIAKLHGADHIICHNTNLGLGQSFQTGIKTALELGADTIVNLDADNQYHAGDVEKLLLPILDGSCKVTIGARPIWQMQNFSRTKKLLQIFGSFTVRRISRTKVKDVTSGFRAIHHSAARNLTIHSSYSYTIEMIMQLGYSRIPIKSVDVRVNDIVLRPSRLVRNNHSYIMTSIAIMARSFFYHHPSMRFIHGRNRNAGMPLCED